MLVHGAYDVREYKSNDGRRLQISYKVNLDYPALAITSTHYQELVRQGWVECMGTKERWDRYTDASTAEEKIVHQYIKSWSNGTQLLTIVMRYESVPTKDPAIPPSPTNSIQNVILLLDKYDSLDQIYEVQRRLGISCGAKSIN